MTRGIGKPHLEITLGDLGYWLIRLKDKWMIVAPNPPWDWKWIDDGDD